MPGVDPFLIQLVVAVYRRQTTPGSPLPPLDEAQIQPDPAAFRFGGHATLPLLGGAVDERKNLLPQKGGPAPSHFSSVSLFRRVCVCVCVCHTLFLRVFHVPTFFH